jgi:hypothetical protein
MFFVLDLVVVVVVVVVVHNKIEHEKHLLRTVVLIKVLVHKLYFSLTIARVTK